MTGKAPAEWREGFVAAWGAMRRIFAMPIPDEATVKKVVRKVSR